MRRVVYTFLAVLLSAAIATPLAAQRTAPRQQTDPRYEEQLKRAQRHETLMSHGVEPNAEDLIAFLRNGFSEEMMSLGLPRQPRMKTEVVSVAFEELAEKRESAAVPLLADVARGTLPPGIDRIARRDLETVPIEAFDEQIRLMRSVLALNAIVALGIIGDEEAKPVILEQMRSRAETAFITTGAIALGKLESNEGLGPLVLLAQDPESPDSAAAFQAIYVLTGRNYGYTANTALAKRRELITQLQDWYEREGADFPVYRTEVMRRINVRLTDDVLDPDSLRGLLRSSTDITNYDRRYHSRQRLMELAPNRFDELRAIVEDKREDLDIRRAAMRWLAISDPREARRPLRRQRDDENPSVREMAEEVLRDLPIYEEEFGRQ